MVIYIHTKISIVLYCSYNLDHVQQINSKILHNTMCTPRKTEPAMSCFFKTQTQQSSRNNLKGGEQSGK